MAMPDRPTSNASVLRLTAINMPPRVFIHPPPLCPWVLSLVAVCHLPVERDRLPLRKIPCLPSS
jgi:hypothetical protein